MISPVAAEAVRRIAAVFAAVFAAERSLIGHDTDLRRAERWRVVAPRVDALGLWLRDQRAMLARHNPVAGAVDHMLKDRPRSPASSMTSASA